MVDFRAFARVPFGHEIINGKAEIKKDAAEQLLNFYKNYIDGDSMATAARKAGLQCSLSHCEIIEAAGVHRNGFLSSPDYAYLPRTADR